MSHFNFHFDNWESQQVLDSDIADIAKKNLSKLQKTEKNRESLLTF